MAGAERNTTPRQREGGPGEHEVSEWKKKKSEPEKERGRERRRRTELAFFVPFRSAAVVTVGEDDDDNVEGDRPCDIAATNRMNI